MLETSTILFFSFAYMGFLFAIAYFGDKHAEMGQSITQNSYIYAFSLAVYCTAWTFYGSVGRAVRDGPGFLTIYIGPVLMSVLGWLVLRKILRISKEHHITSIADFIGSRYGKSTALGGLVTLIAVVGVVPYISLQLKAISTSFLIIQAHPDITNVIHFADVPVTKDTAFYVALLLAALSVIFGTRHLEATERHEGMVAAIAFESVVKLAAFLIVGVYVTYRMFDGPGDIFRQAVERTDIKNLLVLPDRPGTYVDWTVHIFLSMSAVVFLPRQFHVTVVENVNEDHLLKGLWLFPLYLFAINFFVLPVAVAGLIRFPSGAVDADTFVLTLPMSENEELLAFFAYIGGASAATGMVIVETVALSTMICNQLVMPLLLWLPKVRNSLPKDVSTLVLMVRRVSIFLVILFGYAHVRFIGEYYPLVSIGMVSFAAVAQFAPAMIGGLYWKGGSRSGAFWGLIAGFAVWGYTLFLPSFVQTGWLPESFISRGPFGMELLRPLHLFGLTGLSHITHAVFWSLLANIGCYAGISLATRQSAMEHTQAALFVEVFHPRDAVFWRGTASMKDLRSLLVRFLGEQRVREALSAYGNTHHYSGDPVASADPGLVYHAEKLLAGVIGSASARIMVASVVKEEPLGIDEVMNIIDETRQVIIYSQELEKATAELMSANERLKELDRLKDEFISTVTHELRTPITAIRSLTEILHDTPDLEQPRRQEFFRIIIKESERLTRLVNQVLDFQKMESDRIVWQSHPVDMIEVLQDSLNATRPLIHEKKIDLSLELPECPPPVIGDRDRLVQAVVNLISNAVKFCHSRISLRLTAETDGLQVDVTDDGIGIRPEDHTLIFEKFRQITHDATGRPRGSGLGLTITRRIVLHHRGRIWVTSLPDKGATFSFFLPYSGNHPGGSPEPETEGSPDARFPESL